MSLHPHRRSAWATRGLFSHTELPKMAGTIPTYLVYDNLAQCFPRTLVGPTCLFNHRPVERSQRPEGVGKSAAQLLIDQPHPHCFNMLGLNRFQRPQSRLSVRRQKESPPSRHGDGPNCYLKNPEPLAFGIGFDDFQRRQSTRLTPLIHGRRSGRRGRGNGRCSLAISSKQHPLNRLSPTFAETLPMVIVKIRATDRRYFATLRERGIGRR